VSQDALEKLLDSELKLLTFLDLSSQLRSDLVIAFSRYIQLIEKWGKASNLTAIRSTFDMVGRHIIDSLSIVPYIKEQAHSVLDVGTGAGLPGIPLSLVLKHHHFTLLDSSLKKQIFLQEVVQLLKLRNVTLECVRSEVYQTQHPFNTIVSRAFAPLSKMLCLTKHLLAPDGQFLAMKGKIDPQEIESIGKDFKIHDIINLQDSTLKNTNNQKEPEARHLIIVRPNH